MKTQVFTKDNLNQYHDLLKEYISSETEITSNDVINALGYKPLENNTTYSNALLGQGHGACSTSTTTSEKAVTLSNYVLVTGGIVSILFTYAVSANATLNINNQGAKAIYYKNSPIISGVIKAGDHATFIYTGTYYHLIAIDNYSISNINNLQETLDEINDNISINSNAIQTNSINIENNTTNISKNATAIQTQTQRINNLSIDELITDSYFPFVHSSISVSANNYSIWRNKDTINVYIPFTVNNAISSGTTIFKTNYRGRHGSCIFELHNGSSPYLISTTATVWINIKGELIVYGNLVTGTYYITGIYPYLYEELY